MPKPIYSPPFVNNLFSPAWLLCRHWKLFSIRLGVGLSEFCLVFGEPFPFFGPCWVSLLPGGSVQQLWAGATHQLRCSCFSCTWALSCPEACGILIPRPGMELGSPALAGGFLSAGTTTVVPASLFSLFYSINILSPLFSCLCFGNFSIVYSVLLTYQEKSVLYFSSSS